MPGGFGARLALAMLGIAVALPAVGTASAQGRATPPLDPSHWAYDALDRLHAAGLLVGHGFLPGDRPQPRAHIGEALEAAARNAAGTQASLSPFAEGVRLRFVEEFGEPYGPRRFSSRVWAGAREAENLPRDRGGVVAGAAVDVWARPWLAAQYQGEAWIGPDSGGVRHDRFSLTVSGGRWWGFAGRERVGYGPGAAGGVVISPAASFDGVGVGLTEPVRLPWVLGALGPFRATALFSYLSADSLMPDTDAFFSVMRISFAPHPRLVVGANRSLLLVREHRGERLGFSELGSLLFGSHTQLEDQKASIEARLRLGLWGIPLETYFELGVEDTGGAAYTDPGLVAGVHVPILPGWPAASLRYEYGAFGKDAQYCWFCRFQSRSWYHHNIRAGYMTDDGVVFGHPLAGYGHEHRIEAAVWVADARLRMQGTALWRERREDNLLAGTRPGSSRGFGVDLAYRANPRLDVTAAWWSERGDAGWGERRGWLGVRAYIGGGP